MAERVEKMLEKIQALYKTQVGVCQDLVALYEDDDVIRQIILFSCKNDKNFEEQWNKIVEVASLPNIFSSKEAGK